jgi:hypothetical protein
VGVAVAKDRKYASPPKYRQPSRILKMYIAKMRFQKRQAIAEKIGSYTHTSERYAVQHTIPALQPLFRKGKGAAIAEELDLSAEEVAWLER